jgi:hypothetical protein
VKLCGLLLLLLSNLLHNKSFLRGITSKSMALGYSLLLSVEDYLRRDLHIESDLRLRCLWATANHLDCSVCLRRVYFLFL